MRVAIYIIIFLAIVGLGFSLRKIQQEAYRKKKNQQQKEKENQDNPENQE